MYQKPTNKFKKEFIKKVKSAKSIVITSHISPDDDSISSVLSVYYYLTNYLKISSKKINMLYSGEKANRWNYFKNYEKIKFVQDIFPNVIKSDVLIMLDGSNWDRFSSSEDIKNHTGYTICIDHHSSPSITHDLHIICKDYMSTAGLIYKLFLEKEKIDKNISEILLLGILGDTGNFRFVDSNATEIFFITERLVRGREN